MPRIAVTTSQALFPAIAAKYLPAITAAVMGFAILFVVGLAQPMSVHNAAHDSRHGIAFPCH
ncbi:MAG: CbtB domain-containing protein [Alphaproteobacteria bacterium]|nr:CbtB domain-containing protein [Alphaproteobacteria bacterium]MDP6565084.1 CbtB domain-containing protein [Alphaproteobacteria bacterium]MDP6813256.1 CbtB domain-containing protein [Alphaproteobacteria bacterium]